MTAGTLGLDIATAGLHELAAWCRSLGLAETGAVDELRARLYAHYGVAAPNRGEAADRTIEIRSARDAEYFTIEDSGDTMVRLKGGVVLVMTETKRSWTHEIRAREITYNQSLNLLSARGDIEYKLDKPEGKEFFYGEALDVDLATWTGTFLDGRIIRSTTGSGLEKKFTFSADVIEKGGGDVSVFTDAVISSCPDYERPHYSIRASKAWILGKSEWGLANAVLSVGEVPVLYLPFFYYTGEEIYFHPVIGTKDREGYFANATVYLLGQKKPAEESISLLQLNAQDTTSRKRLVGVYLLSTDQKKEKSSADYFKVMLDAYTNLGVLAGIEGAFSSNPALPTLNLSGVAALTRNVYAARNADGSQSYSPFSDRHGWDSVWNSSSIFGAAIPFRFGVELGATYRLPKIGLSLGLQLPFYTDPYVEQDFDVRSEDMNWFSFLEEKKSSTTAVTKRDQLEMKAEGSYAPDLGMLKPYLNSLNLSSLRTKLVSRSRKAYTSVDGTETAYESEDPAREFFAPEQWTMAEATVALSGSLFSYPLPAKRAKAEKPEEEGKEAEPLPSPRSPWYEEKAAESPGGKAQGKEEKPGAGEEGPEEADLSGRYRHAPIKIEAGTSPSSRSPFTFSLGYDLSPSGSLERSFASSPWRESADVDWAGLYDRRLLKLSGGLKAQAALYGSLATANAGLSYTVQRQEHSAFNPDPVLMSETAINNRLLTDYQALQDKLTANLSLGTNPLQDIPMWNSSSLSYKIDCVLRNMTYTGLDPATGEPIYAVAAPGWDKETVTGHNVTLTLGAKPLGWSESLTLAANLPPLDQSYQASLSLKAWDGSLTASNRIYWDEKAGDWKFDELKATASYAFMPKVSLSESFGYNLNDDHPSSNSVSLSLWDFSASLTHAWGKDLSLNSRTWVEIGDDGLQASALGMNYASSVKPIYLWKNRVVLKPALTSALSVNFLRYTSSSFSFVPSLSLTVTDFLELSFSSTSLNNKVYSYLVGLPGFETDMGLSRRNVLADLADSFAFWDDDLRKASNFKLKGIKVSAVHHLDDWDLTLSYEGKSEFDSTAQAYLFNPYFTLNLAWKQIPEFKTEIEKAPKTFTLK